MSQISIMNKNKKEVTMPKWYNVILHNDDVTPFQYVQLVLITLFEKNEKEALDITNSIHKTKGGIAGTYSKEIAQEKVNDVRLMNSDFGMNLVATCEES